MDELWAKPIKGTVFFWMGVHLTVKRVASDFSWADVQCEQYRQDELQSTWAKRQPLPFPDEAELVIAGGA
jgi:hypothetical protein